MNKIVASLVLLTLIYACDVSFGATPDAEDVIKFMKSNRESDIIDVYFNLLIDTSLTYFADSSLRSIDHRHIVLYGNRFYVSTMPVTRQVDSLDQYYFRPSEESETIYSYLIKGEMDRYGFRELYAELRTTRDTVLVGRKISNTHIIHGDADFDLSTYLKIE